MNGVFGPESRESRPPIHEPPLPFGFPGEADTVVIPNPISIPTRALVVEAEPNIRELVCLHLGLEGYTCDGVGEGRSALIRLKAERFDLLVLDVMIPGIDGLSLCRAVRKGDINQDIPILMLSVRR